MKYKIPVNGMSQQKCKRIEGEHRAASWFKPISVKENLTKRINGINRSLTKQRINGVKENRDAMRKKRLLTLSSLFVRSAQWAVSNDRAVCGFHTCAFYNTLCMNVTSLAFKNETKRFLWFYLWPTLEWIKLLDEFSFWTE